MNGKRDFTPIPKDPKQPKGKVPVKKQRTDNTGKLRKKLDTVFSIFIRKLSPKCFTCDKGKNEHCGHYMKRGNDSTRWHIDNARPQCWECNVLKEGNHDEFRKRLIAEIGASRVLTIEHLSRVDMKFSAPELQEIIDLLNKKN